jgi:hypothetical protein
MAKTRAQLQAMLDDLAQAMPQILNTGSDFWCEFAAWADPIQDAAEPDQADFVDHRIGAILRMHGKEISMDTAPTDCWPANDLEAVDGPGE